MPTARGNRRRRWLESAAEQVEWVERLDGTIDLVDLTWTTERPVCFAGKPPEVRFPTSMSDVFREVEKRCDVVLDRHAAVPRFVFRRRAHCRGRTRNRRGVRGGQRHQRGGAGATAAAHRRDHARVRIRRPSHALRAVAGAGSGGSSPRAPVREERPLHDERPAAARNARLAAPLFARNALPSARNVRSEPVLRGCPTRVARNLRSRRASRPGGHGPPARRTGNVTSLKFRRCGGRMVRARLPADNIAP